MKDDKKGEKAGLAYLLDKARGPDRSFREYARAAGVSSTAISRLMKGDYIPKPDTIEKLTSEAAGPRGGVTYEEMMQAAGYSTGRKHESDYLAYIPKEGEKRELYTNGDQVTIDITKEDGGYSALSRDRRLKLYQEAACKYDKDVTAQIYTSLAEKGIVFKRSDEIPSKTSRRDLYIRLFEQPINNWMFDYRYCSDRGMGFNISRIQMMLGGALLSGYDEDTKLSYVVNDIKVYQYLERYDHRLPFRGELSVILYDEEKGILTKEFYLSNYTDGDTTKEVYLA